jgi:hypothetical protein
MRRSRNLLGRIHFAPEVNGVARRVDSDRPRSGLSTLTRRALAHRRVCFLPASMNRSPR